MKVIMSAFACEPDRGSEPGTGWNWAVQAARSHEVWVVTRTAHRTSIERHLQHHSHKRLHFIFVDLPAWMIWWQQGVRHIRLYYVLWQALIVPVVFVAQRRHRFDVIHHVTFNTIDVPGFLWLLNVPFVWGPVGGGQIPPESLKVYYGARWRKEQLRILRKKSLRFDPIVRMGIRKAAHILAANGDTERRLRHLGARRVSLVVEAGTNLSDEAHEVSQDEALSIVWAGLLEHRKAPMLALDVLHQLLDQGVEARLWMIGDGPLRTNVEQTATRYGLQDHLHLTGAVPHAIMHHLYTRGDVFLFTSLQDTSGTVLLEAMAASLPVVTLGHQGAVEMVTPETGILIPIESREQVVHDLASALASLARDPDSRATMGRAGRQRVEQLYSWNRKGEFLRTFYEEVLERTR